MKRTATLALAALVALCLCAAGCTERGRRNSASRIVNRDLAGITSLAEQILEDGQVPEDASITGVETIEYFAPGWVAFQTGGRGVGPSSAYCGFYYSKEDQPMGFQGTDMELAPSGENVWTWQGQSDGQGGGDNRYYTERFQFGWFYYEMYF